MREGGLSGSAEAYPGPMASGKTESPEACPRVGVLAALPMELGPFRGAGQPRKVQVCVHFGAPNRGLWWDAARGAGRRGEGGCAPRDVCPHPGRVDVLLVVGPAVASSRALDSGPWCTRAPLSSGTWRSAGGIDSSPTPVGFGAGPKPFPARPAFPHGGSARDKRDRAGKARACAARQGAARGVTLCRIWRQRRRRRWRPGPASPGPPFASCPTNGSPFCPFGAQNGGKRPALPAMRPVWRTCRRKVFPPCLGGSVGHRPAPGLHEGFPGRRATSGRGSSCHGPMNSMGR